MYNYEEDGSDERIKYWTDKKKKNENIFDVLYWIDSDYKDILNTNNNYIKAKEIQDKNETLIEEIIDDLGPSLSDSQYTSVVEMDNSDIINNNLENLQNIIEELSEFLENYIKINEVVETTKIITKGKKKKI